MIKKTNWENLDSKIREMIRTACRLGEIDFEKECVKNDEYADSAESLSPWMTRREAAKYAKCSADTIDNWCANGDIVHSKMGEGKPGRVLIDRESLERFILGKRVNPRKAK